MADENNIKLVAVGDGAVGKTCLLICFAKGTFPESYVPTVFENYRKTINVDDKEYCFDIWDTAGQEDFDRLRPLSYPDSDIVLICYSVVHRASFKNVSERWLPEVRHYCPNVPILLVGLKIDIRGVVEDPDGEPSVTTEEGSKLKDDLNLSAFIEASSKTREGLEEVFTTAKTIVVNSHVASSEKKKAKKNKCSLL